jgi:hypothetical protein
VAAVRQAHSENPYAATATPVANRPTGTVDGDLLFTFFYIDRTTETVTTLAGWTLLQGPTDSAGSGDARGYLYWKIASGEPASWTWTKSAAIGAGCITVVRVDGHDAGTPIDVSNSQGTSAGTTHATPSINPTASDELCLFDLGLDLSASSTPQFTWPGGPTEYADYEHSVSFFNAGSAWEVRATGAISHSVTSAVSDEGVTFAVAIKTSAGGGPDMTMQPAVAGMFTPSLVESMWF